MHAHTFADSCSREIRIVHDIVVFRLHRTIGPLPEVGRKLYLPVVRPLWRTRIDLGMLCHVFEGNVISNVTSLIRTAEIQRITDTDKQFVIVYINCIWADENIWDI